jgi:DNA-binding transcriptional regulator YhcF (GntR family)
MSERTSRAKVVRQYRFTTIPEWVLYHPQLSPLAVRVYGVLDRRGHEPTHCFPSHAEIAKKAQVSARSVARPLAELEAVGAIRAMHRGSATGGRTSDGYFLAGDSPLPALTALLNALTEEVTAQDLSSKRVRGRGSNRAREREERESVEREPVTRKPPVVPLADFEDLPPLPPVTDGADELAHVNPDELTPEQLRRQMGVAS